MRNIKSLFHQLYAAGNENAVDAIIQLYPNIFHEDNWEPYGNDRNYFGIMEAQQANPIPALIEKITNSIDAVLMRKCLEADINPSSAEAPRSMEEAIQRFFPNYKDWDLRQAQRIQAEEIQIIADGPKGDTSLIIYDNGEGQAPDDFENTFLSLLKGNKTKIQFVQGKFNMGGSGALVFCGEKRYQLLASRRYSGGPFGFTLVRRHQLTEVEAQTVRSNWYEYLRIDGQIPRFEIDEMDLGLYNRKFKTGTLIKLYSYQMQGISDISRDLNRSLNEYLFEPALPFFTIEKKERYPKTPQPQRELYGLKRRLEKQKETYLEVGDGFSEEYNHAEFGTIHVQVFVFKTKIKGKSIKESKKTIRNEFFSKGMHVLFGLNGQVHGHYTTEFISRTLKFNLLKDYLLIVVDCSAMKTQVRNELFMSSRDRLKEGKETKNLRHYLGEQLRQGKLKEIFKRRKNSLAVDEGETNEIIESIARDIKFDPEMLSLINEAFSWNQPQKTNSKKKGNQTPKEKKEPVPFNPQRFPTYFRMRGAKEGKETVIQIPKGSSKTIRFETDVENQFFDRTDEPGEMRISILGPDSNNSSGGNGPGDPQTPTELMNIVQSSPDKGIIKVILEPTKDIPVGSNLKVQVDLDNPGGQDYSMYFLSKIVEPAQPQKDVKKVEPELSPAGLPTLILAYKEVSSEEKQHKKSWEEIEESGIELDSSIVMQPDVDENEKLDRIIINMDSSMIKNFKRGFKNEEQFLIADKKYITSIYFHTLILYATLKANKYQFSQKPQEGNTSEKDLTEVLSSLFSSPYGEFLLKYKMQELIEAVS